MKRQLTIAAALCLAGCATGYNKFYYPNTNVTPEFIAAHRVGPAPAQPILDHTGLAGETLVRWYLVGYLAQGYSMIGYSSFNAGGGQSDQGALEQGRKVGADLVVMSNPAYTGTRSTVIPAMTPAWSASYISGTAKAYGSGGSATEFGTSQTSTYGMQTNHIPMHGDRFDYLAIYLVKTKAHLGATVQDLTLAQQQEIQFNYGVIVLAITSGSPAYDSDIFAGDVILTVDGKPVGGVAGYFALIDANAGRRVDLTLYRHGAVVTKSVQLNP